MSAREKEERSNSGEDNRVGQQEIYERIPKNTSLSQIVNCFNFYLRLEGLRNQLDYIFSTLD